MTTGIEKQESKHLGQINKLCDLCNCDREHAQQVKRLALSFYDQTAVSLNLPNKARRWVEYAALLHDIGWVNGRNGHHKATLDMILSTSILDFKNKDRYIIGSIARYHRKALPSKKHDHYAALESKEQCWVSKLGIILRFANALDASHHSIAEEIQVKMKKHRMIIHCIVTKKYEAEKIKAEACIPLIEDLFGVRAKLSWMNSKIIQKN